MKENIESTLREILRNKLSDDKFYELITSIKAGTATFATGERSVALGGDLNGGVINTGNQNIIENRYIFIQASDVEAIQKCLAFLQIDHPNNLPLDHPSNLPRSGISELIGRSSDLVTLNNQLQSNEKGEISAIVGMGGIGKTELAIQYALTYQENYQGGICWLQANRKDIGTQIIQFAKSKRLINPYALENMDLLTQVQYCWSHCPPGNVLIILDDVTNYRSIEPYLPPNNVRFKVLMTTRMRLGKGIKQLELQVLTEKSALEFLSSIIDSDRVNRELKASQNICGWLGYLPLGLELVGRYLAVRIDLSISHMLQRLEEQRLAARAVNKPEPAMTAKLGVAAAFQMSWDILDFPAQELLYFLSLFELAPIPWSLVEACLKNKNIEELEDLREDSLRKLHLIKWIEPSTYQLHSLIREFLHKKEDEIEESDNLKKRFTQELTSIAETIVESPTQQMVLELKPLIPHISRVAVEMSNYLDDKEFIIPFKGIGYLYGGQGFYLQKESWYKNCKEITESRFGDNHLNLSAALTGLASAYYHQANYSDAKPLYQKALKIRQHYYDQKHPEIADSLNDLGLLFKAEGNYDKAESLYIQSLRMRRELLGETHPDVADSLNNLGMLYNLQGRYREAEGLIQQALNIRESVLGKNHPRVGTSYNNLAYLLDKQENYSIAADLYSQALEIYKSSLGEVHPETAYALNNLAKVRIHQEKYQDAELLLNQALDINKEILGDDHPNVAVGLDNIASVYDMQGFTKKAEKTYLEALEKLQKALGSMDYRIAITMNNLAKFYHLQKRYTDAQTYYSKAILILEKVFGDNHPIVKKVKDNLAENLEQISS